ncbi:MAG: DUF805 domain-containing protein [Pseudomonadota bacterium]
MGFAEAVKMALMQRFADFQGRSRRSEYWWFFLFQFLFSLVGQILIGVLAAAIPIVGGILGIVFLIAIIAMIIPGIAVSIRRLHDLDKSGWWLLIGLIPLAGLILLYWFCLTGTDGDNRFGPDPKGNVADRFA